MSDLNQEGNPQENTPKAPPAPPTDGKVTKKPLKPEDKANRSKEFEYRRGNFDTALITLVATLNQNVVALTDEVKDLKKELLKKNG